MDASDPSCQKAQRKGSLSPSAFWITVLENMTAIWTPHRNSKSIHFQTKRGPPLTGEEINLKRNVVSRKERKGQKAMKAETCSFIHGGMILKFNLQEIDE